MRRVVVSLCLLGLAAACSGDDDNAGTGRGGRSNSGGTSGREGGAVDADSGAGGGAGREDASAGDAGDAHDGRVVETGRGGSAGAAGGAGAAGASTADATGGSAGAAGRGGTFDGGGGAGGSPDVGSDGGIDAGSGGASGAGVDGGGMVEGGAIDSGGPIGNPACGVNIDHVSASTQVQVNLAAAGSAIPASNTAKRGLGYVVTGRDALFRAAVTATNTVTDITATLTLTSGGSAQSLVATQKAPAKSSDATLASTFNFAAPGAAIQADTTYSVTLRQSAACTSPGAYRFPAAGEQALEARDGGTLSVAVLVTKFSGVSAAVFDDQRKQMLLDDLRRYYPQIDVKIRVIPGVHTWSFSPGTVGDQSGVYDGCGAYFSDTSKFPRSKEFLICVYRQQEAFPRGVSGGIAYLTEERDLRATDIGTDATAVIGYSTSMIPTDADYPNWMRITFVHELGHTLGLPHAPSNGAADPDPAFPYAGGTIGVYGWDGTSKILRDPKAPDLMGYQWDFPPKVSDALAAWISDYYYGKIVRRLQRIETFKLLANELAVRRYRSAVVQAGRPRLTESTFRTAEPPSGTPITLTVRRKGAAQTETTTGYWQRSSDANISRVVFPDDGTLESVWIGTAELKVR